MTTQSDNSLKAGAEAWQFVRFLALGGCAAPGSRRFGLYDRHDRGLHTVSPLRVPSLAPPLEAPGSSSILQESHKCGRFRWRSYITSFRWSLSSSH